MTKEKLPEMKFLKERMKWEPTGVQIALSVMRNGEVVERINRVTQKKDLLRRIRYRGKYYELHFKKGIGHFITI